MKVKVQRLCPPGKDLRLDSHLAIHKPTGVFGHIDPGEAHCTKTHLGRLKVDEDMMIIVDGMCICIRIASPPLKVLPAYKAAVDVDI